jgi:hypothetical protein
VLRGDRQGDGGPGDLEGRACLGRRGLQGLVGWVKSLCLAAGDEGSGDRVGGDHSAGGGVVVGAKSMRVRIVLRWKRIQVDQGFVDVDLLEFEEVLDCRHNWCLLASWGNPRG